jgi:hypothetical protein
MTPTMHENPGPDLRPVLEPLAVMPTQMAPARSPSASQRLMLAVLREALDDYRRALTSTATSASRDRFALEAWFWSDAVKWPYSFVNICQALGLDVDALQGALGRWRVAGRELGFDPGASLRMRLPHRPQRGSRTRTTSNGRVRRLRRAVGV